MALKAKDIEEMVDRFRAMITSCGAEAACAQMRQDTATICRACLDDEVAKLLADSGVRSPQRERIQAVREAIALAIQALTVAPDKPFVTLPSPTPYSPN